MLTPYTVHYRLLDLWVPDGMTRWDTGHGNLNSLIL